MIEQYKPLLKERDKHHPISWEWKVCDEGCRKYALACQNMRLKLANKEDRDEAWTVVEWAKKQGHLK